MHRKAGNCNYISSLSGSKFLGPKKFPNKQPNMPMAASHLNMPMAPSPQEAADGPVAAVVAQMVAQNNTMEKNE